MKKIKLLISVFIFLMVLNVKAIDACTDDEMARLKELANNVEIKYDYELFQEESDDDGNKKDTANKFAQYKIKILNLNESLRISYQLNLNNEKRTTKEELENETFYEGTSLKISIYARTTNLCTDKLLKTNNIKFQYYNNFYEENKNKCEEYNEFKYCKEFTEKSIDKEKVSKEFQNYIKEINKQNINNSISYFINNYLYKILMGIAIIGLGVVIFIIRRKKIMEGL